MTARSQVVAESDTDVPCALAALVGGGSDQSDGRHGLPQVSVVVPTIGASTVLGDTLRSALGSHYPDLEVVLVLNGSEQRAARVEEEHASLPVGFVREPRLGAARARNTGARHALGRLLVFVDDDVTLHPHMVCNAVAPLLDDSLIGCVTGRILPTSVESEAQRLLEEYGGYDKGPDTRRFSARDFRRGGALYPFLPGRLGSGAAIAMRRSVFRSLGGFDERLGPGTVTRGAEDLDLLVQTLKAGWEVQYTPSAVVRHLHRCDLGGLASQLHGYGIGMGALITKESVRNPASAFRMLSRIPVGARYVLSPRSAKNARKTAYRSQLTVNELAGLLLGPLALGLSCLQSRRGTTAVRAPARDVPQLPPWRAADGAHRKGVP